MKKSRILGYALTLAATLMVGSAMGQIPTTGNYVKVGTETDEGDAKNRFSLVQKGVAYGFYVEPDAAFHPTYSADGKLTKDFTWNWVCDPATGVIFSNATGTGTGAANGANFTTISFPSKASYVVKVSEKAPSSWGLTCAAAERSFTVYAFDAPTFSSTQDTTKTDTDVNKRKPVCKLADLSTFKFNITSSGTPYVNYKVSVHKAYINATTGVVNVGENITTVTGFTPIPTTNEKFGSAPWDYAVSSGSLTGTTNSGALSIAITSALAPATQELATYELSVDPSKLGLVVPTSGIVAYRITLISANGLISRKGDFGSTGVVPTYTYYAADGVAITGTGDKNATYDLVIAAAPKTGPVYHIGNNKAN